MPEYKSRTSTHGRNMAGARGLWRATGMSDEDFGKPIIAIANSFVRTGFLTLEDIEKSFIIKAPYPYQDSADDMAKKIYTRQEDVMSKSIKAVIAKYTKTASGDIEIQNRSGEEITLIPTRDKAEGLTTYKDEENLEFWVYDEGTLAPVNGGKIYWDDSDDEWSEV